MPAYTAESYAIRSSISKLDKMIISTGAANSDPELKKATIMKDGNANVLDSLTTVEREKYDMLSKYGRDEYKMALELQFLRKQLAQLEEMEAANSDALKGGKLIKGKPPHSQQDISRLTMEIRKRLNKIQTHQKEMTRAAVAEGRQEDAREVLKHVEATKQLYKKRFSVQVPAVQGGSGEELAEMRGGMRSSGAANTPLLDKEIEFNPNVGTECRDSLRNDSEFQQFFAQVAERDAEIDLAVDRIAAGTQKLRDQALGINEELVKQKGLLKDAEEKVDNITAKTKNLNKRLKNTIEKVDQDKFCVYIFCCVLLLSLVGVCLVVTGVIKS